MSTTEERMAALSERIEGQIAKQRRLAKPEEYLYDKTQGKFWDIVTMGLHDAEQVDASIPQSHWRVMVEEGDPQPAEGEPRRRGRPRQRRERLVKPSTDIMRVENDQFVEGSTWWPGQPKIIRDILIDDKGWRLSKGARIYNTYCEPPAPTADPAEAKPWLEHVEKLIPEEVERQHFLDWAAHMVQHPDEKPNFGVLLAGQQGIGKDALIEPMKRAVGAWNVESIDPDQAMGDFNPFLRSVLLVINEIRPTESHLASQLYNKLKTWTAAPPDTLSINQKYRNPVNIRNVLRPLVTTNHPTHFRLEKDDRRWLVIESMLPARWNLAQGDPEYFTRYFEWLDKGGADCVSAWLRARDLSRFDAKAPPPRTEAWHRIVNSWFDSDDVLARVLELVPNSYERDGTPSPERGKPELFFLNELLDQAFDERDELERALRSTRTLVHRFEEMGYQRWKPQGTPEQFQWQGRVGETRYRSRGLYVRRDRISARGVAGLQKEAQERIDRLAALKHKAEDAGRGAR